LSIDVASAIVQSRYDDAQNNYVAAGLIAARRRQRKERSAHRIRLTRLAVS
jgi:hypothetical protein